MQEVQSIVKPELNNLIDRVEELMINKMVASGEFHLIDPEENVVHLFTPGIYTREITMYPGQRITSKIHKSEHQFIISQGLAVVYDEEGSHILSAPYRAVTKAGTRRVLLIPEECEIPCIWTTVHAIKDGENTVDRIEDRIIEKRSNPLLIGNDIQLTNKIKN